jgi:hypothetical protein
MSLQDIANIQPEKAITFSQWCSLIAQLVDTDQDRVMGFREWCEKASISEKNGRGIIERGDIPVVQLSPNRIGIRVCDHRAWLAARTRKARAK